ncbi:MAG: hypothetical protein ACYTDT_08780 [Planctomycetota bacterium]|jgi:hypothetical protein
MKIAIAVSMMLFFLVGCASPSGHYRLEEYGQGWTLDVADEDGEGLRAKWKAGDNRSTKFVNMDDKGSAYIVSMLYLELEADGNVKNGLMKRFTMKEFSEKTYKEEKGAQWFRVLEGKVTLNDELEGDLKVRAEGNYEFEGEVNPDSEIVIRDREE